TYGDVAASVRRRSPRTPSPRARPTRARPRPMHRNARASSSPHLCDDGVGPIALRRGERALELVVVASVHPRHAPALELEARPDSARPVVGRAVVVDDDRGEPPQPDAARVLHGLPVASLVELAVADETERASARQCDADGDGKP